MTDRVTRRSVIKAGKMGLAGIFRVLFREAKSSLILYMGAFYFGGQSCRNGEVMFFSLLERR